MLDLRAAIGENDLILLAFDRGVGFKRGGNGRSGRGSLHGTGGQLRLGLLARGSRAGRLRHLRLSLRGGRWSGLLGLEVLEAQDDEEHQQSERYG